MSNPTGKGGFVKGDPRINRKGKPKDFQSWRDLLVAVGSEPAVASDKSARGPDGQPAKRLVLIRIPLVKDGLPVFEPDGVTPVMIDHYATNAEMVARQWMQDPKRQQGFVEGAYGKVPQPVDLTTGGEKLPVTFTVMYVDKKPAPDGDPDAQL